MNPSQYIKRLLTRAIQQKATDIYILPLGDRYKFIFNERENKQIDSLKVNEAEQLISYLKFQANMSMSEHRRPQAGTLHRILFNSKIDLRLSTVGDYLCRESMVLRIIYRLNHSNYQLVAPQQWSQLLKLIQGQGLVLFSGPMGSGKTTTMYRLLKEECSNQVVLTIEDTVEIEEPSFLQLQVNVQAQMNYQNLIKLGLRHRPQVFIIGEIRDHETAQAAIEAALSGHLVLSTIHAKSASGVVSRLKQLGIAEYYIDQALLGACYQRLLPLKNDDFAVLFDIKEHDELLKQKENGVGSEWHELLFKAVKEQKISKETLYKFEKG